MRPYPWYDINGLTRELEPYARYSASRAHFEICYQPETDQPFANNGDLDVEALRNSFAGDEERYGWITGDPTIRDIVHMLWGDPAALTKLSEINAEYMGGFRNRPYIVQARIHAMTACRILGETYEDDAINQKLLGVNTLLLWARAWFRAEARGADRFSPPAEELDAIIKKLPPSRNDKFPWPKLYAGLGLSDLPKSWNYSYKPRPGKFSWMMSNPEQHQEINSLLDALDCLGD